jgi:hypothetical protein
MPLENSNRVRTERVSVNLEKVTLPMGLVADRVEIQASELTVQLDPFDVLSPSPAEIVIAVGLLSLASYLETRQVGGLKGFRCEHSNGNLVVHASKRVLIDVPATAECALEVRDGTSLWIRLVTVEVLGGTSIKNLVQSQIDRVNPIFSVAELPVRATLNTAEVTPAGAVIRLEIAPGGAR